MVDTIGYVVGGSLRSNLKIRLTGKPENVQEGSFVVIDGVPYMFYGLVTDLQLGSTDPRFADEQFESRISPQLSSMLLGQTLYTNLEVMPVLMQETVADDQLSSGDEKSRPGPVKTIPTHHSSVRMAEAVDIENIFGNAEDPKNFVVGSTREQGHPICIDLEKFVKRSSGIFGATGTGKSFLTRMILAGLIHSEQASVLLFDMHNEYSFDRPDPDNNTRILGLKNKFSTKVEAFGLGSGTLNQGVVTTAFMIAESDIEPSDILRLRKELNLLPSAEQVVEGLYKEFGQQWFTKFKALSLGTKVEDENGKLKYTLDSVEGLAESIGIHPESARALYGRLTRLFDKPYIIADKTKAQDSLRMMIDNLQNKKHVFLTFGNYDQDVDYLLVANIITRRIREAWVQHTEEYNRNTAQNPRPRPLVIVVEEAHKLLNSEMASQTIFSTIARELRKYYVTLLVVDQRPSQIYDEVMSQLGTRISGWLGDDTDISAVLSGLSNKDQLRGMLSHLQEKEEVLLLGWGVPMPMPVRSRRYDDVFWDELLGAKANNTKERTLEAFNQSLGL